MRRVALPLISILFSLFILNTSHAAGTTYKWTDSNGSVVYSQHPPAEGIAFERIQTKAAPRSSSKSSYSAPSTSSAKDSIMKDKAAHDENALVQKETEKNAAEREENCKLAKDRMRFYQVQRRWKDKDGNVQSLEDDERMIKLNEAKQQVADFCS